MHSESPVKKFQGCRYCLVSKTSLLLYPCENDAGCFKSGMGGAFVFFFRLLYQQQSMWMAMCWLSQTTCLYTTIPNTGGGLAALTPQKVRPLLIWKMVGTHLHVLLVLFAMPFFVCFVFLFFFCLFVSLCLVFFPFVLVGFFLAIPYVDALSLFLWFLLSPIKALIKKVH